MKILLANPRGFCAGVNMAIECLERALEFFGPPLYVYHEIVHNKFVVDRFRERGTVFVESLDEVPPGSPLLYSAHGVSPQIRDQAQKRRLLAIDATCPLVIKVHLEAVRYAREGYTIFLIGHEGHDEVIGTMGEAPNQMILVETAQDVDRLTVPDPDKVAYLTQTTLSVDDANIVIAALRKKFPSIANPPKDDICYATQNRQEAVRHMAAQANLVLVLGSQNSSNSRRLAEIANGLGIPSYLIDGVGEIRDAWFEGVDTLLVTAGAQRLSTSCRSALNTWCGISAQRFTRRRSGRRTFIFRFPGHCASCFPQVPAQRHRGWAARARVTTPALGSVGRKRPGPCPRPFVTCSVPECRHATSRHWNPGRRRTGAEAGRFPGPRGPSRRGPPWTAAPPRSPGR